MSSSGGFGSGFAAPPPATSGAKRQRHDDDDASAKRPRAPEAASTTTTAAAAAAAAKVYQQAMNGAVAAVEAALELDASLLERPQVGGLFDSRRLLHCAAARGHEALVRALLARGADAGAVDKRGATAASLAAKQGHANIAALLEAGAAAAPSPQAEPPATAPPAAAAASAEDESDGPQYTDAELLEGTGASAAEKQHASDIYDILGEGVDDDLLQS